MKLIDIETSEEQIKKELTKIVAVKQEFSLSEIVDILYTLPKVEAIPIWWIEQYQTKRNMSLKGAIETMLKEWRKNE